MNFVSYFIVFKMSALFVAVDNNVMFIGVCKKIRVENLCSLYVCINEGRARRSEYAYISHFKGRRLIVWKII